MIATLTKPQTQIIEIHIVRHGNFYFYSRYVDGNSEIFGEVITQQRASDLITMYQVDEQIEISTRHGKIQFKPDTNKEFSFMAKWVVKNG